MSAENPSRPISNRSRRDFLKTTAAAAAGGLALARGAHAQGSDEIKIGLVGAGGRGVGAAFNALSAKPNVKLVALADAFEGQVTAGVKVLKDQKGDQVDVPPERQFVGLDAYQKLLQCDLNVVLLCTPPGFRPDQFEAAVAAGKHVFMEKPVAVDAPGVRKVMAVGEEAKKKGLLVAVGHHLRYETKHSELIARIHDGQIGDVMYSRAYFNSGGVWTRNRLPEHTELGYQVWNWYYFNWLSGDHIVEQHVHDLDVCNWFKKDAHPTSANGMGGRQVRISPDHGEIYDHHAVEFTYEDGSRAFSYCRHIPGCWNSFAEYAHGTKGFADIQGHGRSVLQIDGQDPIQWQREGDGHQIEMDVLFGSLLRGEIYNEADRGAVATMTAILGRMATYSGNIVTWDEGINSQIKLGPATLVWDAEAPVKPGPDGLYPSALPGLTKVV